ncbi:protein of unknown function [Taphrina deformans PYCC 5710]|uniref:Ubiquitin carboxyl-terminal hydrolase n=1 Tax=Taphrina deformans (strain PYCC 5710 / ATCC 11124 / CBS 356.35 / IMI 108563 / JCM 9778 / NBRC 8474) TaxID=1097556 RepID=R4XEC5_TAPDE|nr:protein of unknown function [Taphrina deformans PYCC 5710]|eukprot:CCG84177.1 protein of unknown function [Taphrina deformans PYCC 5710]
MSWLTIESDPAVFSALISDLGVRDVVVEEVFSIDAESLDAITPAYGFIFLFKYQRDSAQSKSAGTPSDNESIWFAHQIIQNACGTQAILAILLNQPDIVLGPELSSFKEFTVQFPADLRGETMTNSDLLRTVHNSFSRSEMFHQENDPLDGESGEAPHHFVAYSRIDGRLYELDGLRPSPIDHGPCPAQMGTKLQEVIGERVARYAADEVHFNLLALTRDPLAADGAHLSDHERTMALQNRDTRDREVELRRHNFATAILEMTRQLLKNKSRVELDGIIHNARATNKRKRELRP